MDKKRILVVDDDVAITRFLKMAIERNELYQVEIENKGSRAFQTAKRFKPQLIFLDVVMEDLEGPVVADQIKSDPQFEKTPIIFLTGQVASSDEIEKAGGMIGTQQFMAKPVDFKKLMACIEKNIQ